MIFQLVGAWLKVVLVVCVIRSIKEKYLHHGSVKKNKEFGYVVFGNIKSGMKQILFIMRIIFITTQCDMDMWKHQKIGNIQVFTVMLNEVFMILIGVQR